MLASWHACKKTSLLSKQHCRGSLHLARIGAALLQSLVLHLLEREVRMEKEEMVWMGVEGCTHVDTMSAPIVNFDVRYRRAGQHFLRASIFSPAPLFSGLRFRVFLYSARAFPFLGKYMLLVYSHYHYR